MKKKVYYLALLPLLFLGAKIYAQSGVGLWDDQGSGAESYTTFDLGVGVNPPDGKAEIYYDEATINGLVVTRYGVFTNSIAYDDLVELSGEIEGFSNTSDDLGDDDILLLGGDDFITLKEDLILLKDQIDREEEVDLDDLIEMQSRLTDLKVLAEEYEDQFGELIVEIDDLLTTLSDEKLGTTTTAATMADLTIKSFDTDDKPLFIGRTKTYYTGGLIPLGPNPVTKNRLLLTADGRLGVNSDNPRVTLDVLGVNRANFPTAIFGLNGTTYTRHIQFNNFLRTDALSGLSVMGDQGIFWTDGRGTDGANLYSGLVIAPLGCADGLKISKDGNVGIGTTSLTDDYKLSVEGKIRAREIQVNPDTWADFVFEETYDLMSLDNLNSYISTNKHLPNVPSEKEIMENGVQLGELNTILLQKIEELTLYTIEQGKQIKELQNEIKKLKE